MSDERKKSFKSDLAKEIFSQIGRELYGTETKSLKRTELLKIANYIPGYPRLLTDLGSPFTLSPPPKNNFDKWLKINTDKEIERFQNGTIDFLKKLPLDKRDSLWQSRIDSINQFIEETIPQVVKTSMITNIKTAAKEQAKKMHENFRASLLSDQEYLDKLKEGKTNWAKPVRDDLEKRILSLQLICTHLDRDEVLTPLQKRELEITVSLQYDDYFLFREFATQPSPPLSSINQIVSELDYSDSWNPHKLIEYDESVMKFFSDLGMSSQVTRSSDGCIRFNNTPAIEHKSSAAFFASSGPTTSSTSSAGDSSKTTPDKEEEFNVNSNSTPK